MSRRDEPCLSCQRIRAAVWMLAAVGLMALLPFVGPERGASAMGTKPIANPVADAASAARAAAVAQAEALASAASARATAAASAAVARAGAAVASAAGPVIGAGGVAGTGQPATSPAASAPPATPPAVATVSPVAPRAPAASAALPAGLTTLTLGVPPPPAPAPSAPVAAAPSTATELIYDRLVLVRLPLDQAWKGMALVKNARPSYALSFDPKALPPGLTLGSDGWLRGQPTAAGRYDFVLRLAGESRSVEQRYRVEVFTPVAKAPAGPARMSTLPASAAQAEIDDRPAEPRTWRLNAADLKALTSPAPETGNPGKGGEDERDATKAAALPPAPTADQLTKILAPLEEQEFPTESLFRSAVAANVCRQYVLHVREIAEATGQTVDASCPPPPDGTPAATASRRAFPAAVHQAAARRVVALAAGRDAATPKPATAPRPPAPGAKDITLAQFHDQLMPADVADEIVRTARKRHPIKDAKPLELAPLAGCGCNNSATPDQTYGMLAYWHAGKQPLVVDFGLFTRIGFVGALLDNRGGYTLSYDGGPEQLGFVREAHNRNTSVDLVIYRRDWSMLRRFSAEDRQKFIADAAEGAVRLADAPLDDTSAGMQRMLIPAWREPRQAFDGITLFFDEPSADPADRAAFQQFLYEFVPALAQQMQRSPRGWRLNLVVPDQRLGEQGTYSLDWLWRTFKSPESGADAGARPRASQPQVRPVVSDEDVQAKRDLYQSKGQLVTHPGALTVQYLVLLSEPTTDYKKQLRARLDWSEVVKGDQRVQLMRNLVPVLLTKREGAPDKIPEEPRLQLDDDFAYMSWNFGNLALWPMPAAGLGRGDDVRSLLDTYYGSTDTVGSRVCAVLCPVRVWLRLALQTLLLLGGVAVGLYLMNCDVRKLGLGYRLFLILGGLATLAVGASLLSCDPDLLSWRRNNVLLYAVLLVLFVYGAWRSLKPKEAQP